MKKTINILSFIVSVNILTTQSVFAFPQFEKFVAEHSGKPVNCAMCHANDAGPIGNDPGQLGSLTKAEMEKVNLARLALKPGQKVDSPILNKFGNHIIESIGTEKFTQLLAKPEDLAKELGNQSDLDKDGIPDAQEYLDGTDPLNKLNGDPSKLFVINVQRNAWLLIYMAVSLYFIYFGLTNILKYYKLNKG